MATSTRNTPTAMVKIRPCGNSPTTCCSIICQPTKSLNSARIPTSDPSMRTPPQVLMWATGLPQRTPTESRVSIVAGALPQQNRYPTQVVASNKRSRRIYDAAVGEALIVVWEAADRICGKRLQAALTHLAGGVHGAPWPPGSGPWGAPTTADGQRRHLGPIAPAHQDTGGPPAQTKEAAVAGPQSTGADLRRADLRRLECAATGPPGD